MKFYLSSRARLGLALVCSSVLSLVLCVISSLENDDFDAIYLVGNLGVAWIPLLVTLWLQRLLRLRLWSSWLPLIATGMWLSFLPNSFYLLTYYLDIHELGRVNPLFDLVMTTSFALNGFILGYLSLFLVHQEFMKRLSRRVSALLVGAVLLLASFAIFIGRDLHWNTWDMVLNPASVIFDVSDRLINPSAHPQVFSTTVSLFMLLGSVYVIAWYLLRAVRTVSKN